MAGQGGCGVPVSVAARPTTVGVGTACWRVTTPRTGVPPVTDAGSRVREARVPAITVGVMVSRVVAVRPAYSACRSACAVGNGSAMGGW